MKKAGEITRAIDRMEERKQAAGVGSGVLHDPQVQFRLVTSGLDLDYEEIEQLMPAVVVSAVPGLLHGLPAPTVAASMYFDGIATGLLIAEARAKEAGRR